MLNPRTSPCWSSYYVRRTSNYQSRTYLIPALNPLSTNVRPTLELAQHGPHMAIHPSQRLLKGWAPAIQEHGFGGDHPPRAAWKAASHGFAAWDLPQASAGFMQQCMRNFMWVPAKLGGMEEAQDVPPRTFRPIVYILLHYIIFPYSMLYYIVLYSSIFFETWSGGTCA